MFQANRQQAMQQHQQAQVGRAAGTAATTGNQGPQGAQPQPGQRTQPNNPQSLNQLLPQIQAQVSSLELFPASERDAGAGADLDSGGSVAIRYCSAEAAGWAGYGLLSFVHHILRDRRRGI